WQTVARPTELHRVQKSNRHGRCRSCSTMARNKLISNPEHAVPKHSDRLSAVLQANTRTMTRRTVSIAIMAFVLLFRAVASDWPRFRGPNGSGVSEAQNLPIDFGP